MGLLRTKGMVLNMSKSVEKENPLPPLTIVDDMQECATSVVNEKTVERAATYKSAHAKNIQILPPELCNRIFCGTFSM